MPMIDFSVVVLPTPLRPRRVTTSPGYTSKSTPCRICDSSYHASRPRTVSSGSGMPRAQICLDHLRVPRDAGVVALGEDLAPRQHRDRVGEILDDAQVVLDHQDRAIDGHLADERGDAVDVFVRHARRGL